MTELQLPQVGLYMSQDHRYWWNGKGPVPGATSVIGIMDKPALITWKARETARAILMQPDEYVVPNDDPTFSSQLDVRINAAVKASDKARDDAARIGSSVHLLADLTGRAETGFQVADHEIPYLDAFRGFLAFLEAHRGTIVSSEKAVWSKAGYAGTYDLLCNLECDCHRGLWLIDVKTSKGYYPEYGLQLAAYGYADFIVLPDDPRGYAMPQIERFGILHLRPDQYADTGYRLIEYPVTDRDYVAFLAALELYNWRSENRFSRSILISKPITPTNTASGNLPAMDARTQETELSILSPTPASAEGS